MPTAGSPPLFDLRCYRLYVEQDEMSTVPFHRRLALIAGGDIECLTNASRDHERRFQQILTAEQAAPR